MRPMDFPAYKINNTLIGQSDFKITKIRYTIP